MFKNMMQGLLVKRAEQLLANLDSISDQETKRLNEINVKSVSSLAKKEDTLSPHYLSRVNSIESQFIIINRIGTLLDGDKK